jgi:RND family efflux transporter MFP subunit
MMRVTLSLAIILGLLAAGHAQAEASDGVVVELATAQEQLLSPEQWVPGNVVSRFDSEIAAEVEGALLSVVEVGDRVRAGEPLGQINDELQQIQLRNDDSRVRRLEANITFLDRQLKRFEELVANNSSAELEFDRVRMEREMVVQELVSAEAQRDQTRYQIERTLIVAPFDGVIAERMHQPGEFITTGESLVRLVNDTRLEAKVQAPINVLRYVRPGAQILVETEFLESRATVRAIVPVGDERSRTVELRIALEPLGWVIGEAIRASVPSAAPTHAVTVPRDALVLRDSQVYVFKIGQGGTAERISVVAGDGSADLIGVRGALRAGDRVVIRGAERLLHGQLVKVLSTPPRSEIAAAVSEVAASG